MTTHLLLRWGECGPELEECSVTDLGIQMAESRLPGEPESEDTIRGECAGSWTNIFTREGGREAAKGDLYIF
jgi:hypothetical protein